MPVTRLVAVGAVACDIILGVPFFPDEDSKLRATSFNKRRGGNVGNTLEVMQQLVRAAENPQNVGVGSGSRSKASGPGLQLTLVAALPASDSPSIEFISSSLNGDVEPVENGQHEKRKASRNIAATVDMRHCLFRDGYHEPVTSYIISSGANQSRTIINHNPIPEMTFEEFITIADNLLHSLSPVDDNLWFHFEGRIPNTTLECMKYIRSHPSSETTNIDGSSIRNFLISVELEKPGREGLQELAHQADVVFYSRSWAEAEGYTSAEDCLRQQETVIRSASTAGLQTYEQTLICTWGSDGACGLILDHEDKDHYRNSESATTVIHSPALKSEGMPVVDTTGAGDTFIAGTLHHLLTEDHFRDAAKKGKSLDGQLKNALDFANAIAGKKVLQQGFAGLGA